MILLAVDTSGPVCGVSLLRDHMIVYEAVAVNKLTHSVSLVPMIEEALTRSDLDIADVDCFAAVTGPGSFTGVRIGVSAVKGLAHGANKPCVGVDALEALAMSICSTDALLCPIQDARAGQIYGAAFLPGNPPVRAKENAAEKLGEYLEKVSALAGEKKLCFVGDGLKPSEAIIRETLGERAIIAPAHMCYLRPSSVALLAAMHMDTSMDYLQLMPVYLRAPQAERERARKLGGNA